MTIHAFNWCVEFKSWFDFLLTFWFWKLFSQRLISHPKSIMFWKLSFTSVLKTKKQKGKMFSHPLLLFCSPSSRVCVVLYVVRHEVSVSFCYLCFFFFFSWKLKTNFENTKQTHFVSFNFLGIYCSSFISPYNNRYNPNPNADW